MSNEETMVSNDIVCQQCGGPKGFSIRTQNILCEYCGYEEEIVKSQNIEKHSLTEGTDYKYLQKRNEDKSVTCESCGSVSVIPYLTQNSKCTYCGASNFSILEDNNFIEPDCVIPFKKDKHEATEIFKKWTKTRFFAPNDFKVMYQSGKLNPNYSPAWSFDADTSYYYTGKGGKKVAYKAQKDGKTVTKYRTDWYNTSGKGRKHFEKVFVSDSAKDNILIDKILDEGGLDLYSYDSRYLYSFGAEHYYKGVQVCYPKSQQIIKGEIREMARGEILTRYDSAKIETLDVKFSNVEFAQVLVPVWTSLFYYQGKEYRVMINGYNGDIEGQCPYSVIKIVLSIIVLVLIVVMMVYFAR